MNNYDYKMLKEDFHVLEPSTKESKSLQKIVEYNSLVYFF
jgi:hypothetical protein